MLVLPSLQGETFCCLQKSRPTLLQLRLPDLATIPTTIFQAMIGWDAMLPALPAWLHPRTMPGRPMQEPLLWHVDCALRLSTQPA
jgi:hypothetical protein